MNKLFFLLTLYFVSTNLYAEYSVNPVSHSKLIKSCYRWISKKEMKSWKNGNMEFGLSFNDKLDRDGNTPITYCWENTVGAIIGGIGEVYGDYLLRFDFVEDAILFDRSTGLYRKLNGSTNIPTEMKLGINTEIVYANYKTDGLIYFQEYLIRNPRAIKSWSLGDATLKRSFKEELVKIRSNRLSLEEYHFYRNKFIFPTSSFRKFANGAPYYLERLNKLEKTMDKFWANNSEDLIYINYNARLTIEEDN